MDWRDSCYIVHVLTQHWANMQYVSPVQAKWLAVVYIVMRNAEKAL